MPEGKYEHQSDEAIIALLTHRTVPEAAKAIGIGTATLWRWLQVPDFQERYREARRQAVNHAIAQLQQATSEAVQTLRDIMGDRLAPAHARVSACRTVFEMSVKGVELGDLEAHIKELEALVGAQRTKKVAVGG